MADIQRQASAHWSGDLLRGSGKTSNGSGVLRDVVYSVPSRFESGQGTNPEELIAAAHASCFSMMLAKVLGDQNVKPQRIRSEAILTMRVDTSGPKISKVHLSTAVTAAGLDAAGLQKASEQAKEKCPVS